MAKQPFKTFWAGAKPARSKPAPGKDLDAARALFRRLKALERAYDPALASLYADDGVIIERTVENGVERRQREAPMSRYKATLPEALRVSKLAREHAVHARVEALHLAPGRVVVRSQRRSSQSRKAAPYEIEVCRGEDGVWRIVKEVATLVR
jgi:hypothetical protein